MLWSSDLNKKSTIKCDLVTFFVRTKYFDNLISTNSGSNSCLYLPLKWISKLKLSGFKITQSPFELNGQLSKLKLQSHNKYNAFFIPFKSIVQTWIQFDNENRFTEYSKNVKVLSKILKANDTNLTLNWLDDLLGIKLCVPNHYNLINYSIWNTNKKRIKWSSNFDKIQDFDLDQLSVLSIVIEHKISTKELTLIHKLLKSSKTMLNLSLIDLLLSKQSECFSILSLCKNYCNLKTTKLVYLNADVEQEKEKL